MEPLELDRSVVMLLGSKLAAGRHPAADTVRAERASLVSGFTPQFAGDGDTGAEHVPVLPCFEACCGGQGNGSCDGAGHHGGGQAEHRW
jgi:hypothetical protein